MNCNEFNDKLSLFIDKKLDVNENQEFEKHIKECEKCRKDYETLKRIVDELNALPEEDLPRGYCKKLNNKLIGIKKERKINWHWKRYTAIAATFILIFAAGYAYVSSNNNYNKDWYFADNRGADTNKSAAPEIAMEAPMEEMDFADGNYDMLAENMEEAKVAEEIAGKKYSGEANAVKYDSINQINAKQIKVIKDGYIHVETETFEDFTNELSSTVKTFNGYIQNQQTYSNGYSSYKDKQLKNGQMTVRIPQDKFYEIIDYITNNSEVKNKSTNETDVTKSYYEKDNMVKNLELQEERLRDILLKAENVTEILQIENELRRLRTEIDSLNIDLSNIDDRVSYSTLNIEIREVETLNKNITPVDKTLGQRAKEGFIKTINNIIDFVEELLVVIVSIVPVLIIIGIIAIIILMIIKKRNKKR